MIFFTCSIPELPASLPSVSVQPGNVRGNELGELQLQKKILQYILLNGLAHLASR